jgi:dihydropteroate synthase
MGILNLTPDSFSDGGRFIEPEAALLQARRLREAGARMVDLGGESTRPGAVPISIEEEWRRIEPALAALRACLPDLPISLDTRHPEVASRGLSAGVSVINDVSGLADPAMLDLARHSACGVIAMRSRKHGKGFFMPPYDDPAPRNARPALTELRHLRDRLHQAGLADSSILLDPGFGFGTTFREDLALWEALPELPEALGWPVERLCIGISRKRFLAARAGTPGLPSTQRDAITAVAHSEALRWGYRVFRTHAIG